MTEGLNNSSERSTLNFVEFDSLDPLQQIEATQVGIDKYSQLRREGKIPTGDVFKTTHLVELDDGTVTTTTYSGFIE
jgi:hypothetical protein